MHPGGEIHYLLAVEVDHTEAFALLHLEGQSMGCLANERLRAGRIIW
jgi:hypothetical protein